MKNHIFMGETFCIGTDTDMECYAIDNTYTVKFNLCFNNTISFIYNYIWLYQILQDSVHLKLYITNDNMFF